LQGWKVYLLGL
jgi:hypothetical protein